MRSKTADKPLIKQILFFIQGCDQECSSHHKTALVLAQASPCCLSFASRKGRWSSPFPAHEYASRSKHPPNKHSLFGFKGITVEPVGANPYLPLSKHQLVILLQCSAFPNFGVNLIQAIQPVEDSTDPIESTKCNIWNNT